MMVPAQCSVIVPVHDRAALTARCLDELVARTGADVEIVVVDDASSDSTPRLLERYGERIRVVTHERNTGFADACNHGADAASSGRLVFLNNDTIPQAGWIEALLRCADENPAAAIVGAKLLYPDGTVQHAGVVVCQDGFPRHVYSGFPADHPAVNRSRRLQIVTAACALVSREAFDAVGGFDNDFRNGYEDVDLCLRLGERGYEVRYCPDSVVHHLESASLAALPRARRAREIAANTALYRERWVDRVVPDDLRMYAEDGLLEIAYPGSYPLRLTISPLLGTIDEPGRERTVERLLERRSRQVQGLLGDLVDLSVALAGARSEGSRPCDEEGVLEVQQALVDALPSRRLAYSALVRRIRQVVDATVPSGAIVVMASRGDDELLDLEGRDARHFPQREDGVYAGHHPLGSDEAIAELERLRRAGAGFFVLPNPMGWWLEHYTGFARHLAKRCRLVACEDGTCHVYALGER